MVVGGIIPDQDVAPLKRAGVASVYTPKDFDLTRIMRDIVELVGNGSRQRHSAGNGSPRSGNGSVTERLSARGVSDDGAALGARLRERDLSAAPAALNLLESATSADREQSAALLREVSPQALGGEAPGHVIGITGPPGAGKSTLLSALLHAWREDRTRRSRCWPSTRARVAPAARCSATAPGSSSTPPIEVS